MLGNVSVHAVDVKKNSNFDLALCYEFIHFGEHY